MKKIMRKGMKLGRKSGFQQVAVVALVIFAGWIAWGKPGEGKAPGPVVASASIEQASASAPVIDAKQTVLGLVCQTYLAAGDALVRNDLTEAHQSLKQLQGAIGQVDVTKLDAAGQEQWQEMAGALGAATQKARLAKDLAGVRIHFRKVSTDMISLAQAQGPEMGIKLYKVHCPMAFEDTGADWLQSSLKIANPYYGPEMLRCGTIKPVKQVAKKQTEVVPVASKPVAKEEAVSVVATIPAQPEVTQPEAAKPEVQQPLSREQQLSQMKKIDERIARARTRLLEADTKELAVAGRPMWICAMPRNVCKRRSKPEARRL